ncbi:hypothetical protein H4Q26_017582 [Puccinia striiformis f. sp. tritici PST-130]|uniref:Uncharacterized protein n=1 Tax=Puccinia striiformis f. sp. tritici PST-78 TaxID=1165861 RepID=A0A0L0VI70_9BASI|nr:hypothetical protein H4Q26_017582 [Puccinia striiformis f. sp. tritici PST-130]KNE98699.1 hypothetical protein PSTG_08067 [Puccinia striiformis f. sp. tritici PST-78]
MSYTRDFVYDSADDTKIEEEKGNMIVKVETNKNASLQLPAVWKQIRLVSSRKLFPPIRCSHPSVELIGLQQTARCLISDNVWSSIASSVKIYKVV